MPSPFFQPRYQLSVRVSIQDIETLGNLQVEEHFRVDAKNFFDICQLLGRFHELAEKIKEERGK